MNSTGPEETDALDRDWRSWVHEGQCAPAGDWPTWVAMAAAASARLAPAPNG